MSPKKIITYSILFVLFFSAQVVVGQVMQSTTYKMQADSINIGGGLSTSTSYSMENTVGEVGTGNSSSTTYSLSAGYQSMKETYISITAASDVTLPVIGGLVGGIGTGSSTWLVTTDNPAGYSLNVKVLTNPGLKSGSYSFSDYTPPGADPDFAFSIASSASAFGFSPEGSDVIQRYKDNGSACNVGALNTADACWDGFSTVDKNVATRNSPNHPNGTVTTLKYRAESGSTHVQPTGSYSATVVVTAVTL